MNFSSVYLLALSTFGLSPSLCFAQLDEIPVVTINDPQNGWSPVTYVSISGGTSNVPLLVDTGSSAIAFCNDIDMGNSLKTIYYGCNAYGKGYNGWVGSFYNTSLTFGDYNEEVTDPELSSVALMKTQNAELCTPNIQGIMGTDLGSVSAFFEEQVLPKPGGPENCDFTETAHHYSSQFGKTMLNSADQYTFALIGLSKERKKEFVAKDKVEQTSVMAFGERARERVKEQTSAGSAAFASDEKSWYRFLNNVSFDITGLKKDTDCMVLTGGDCKVTVDNEKTTDTAVIIDSGTQPLVLPWLDGALKEFEGMITDETTLTISIGDVQLFFDSDTLIKWNRGNNIATSGDTSSATIGFPVFWMYDILFDVNAKNLTEKSYGNVTFYKRTHTTSGGANKKSSMTSKSVIFLLLLGSLLY